MVVKYNMREDNNNDIFIGDETISSIENILILLG
jgi:hypothetical protein